MSITHPTLIIIRGCLIPLLFSSCITGISQTLEPKTFSSLYPKQNVDKKPIPYVKIREANIMWLQRVWREVDMRQKPNLIFYFPRVKKEDRVSFTQLLVEAVELGLITAYAAVDSSANGTMEWVIPFSYHLAL